MKRTTIFADASVLETISAIARKEHTSLSAAIRTALEEYIVRRHGKRTLPSFTGVGRSGRSDVAEQAESLLWSAPERTRQ